MSILKDRLTAELYRGDTLENFLQCAIQDEAGRVFTDRTRNPDYKYAQTHASRKYRGVSDPFSYALREARTRNETPTVLVGNLPLLSRPVLTSIATGLFVLLPEGVNMPVDKIWLPRLDFDWRSIDMNNLPEFLKLRDDAEIWRRLELFDPSYLLNKQQAS